MPIIGLGTERPAFPIIGTIRKGAARPDDPNQPDGKAKRPGADLDHFRFVTSDGGLSALWDSAYGQQPREVNVYFPYHAADECFTAWREHWLAGGLVHRCDGETCVLSWDHKAGSFSERQVPCPDRDKPDRERLCRPVGRLTVVVKEFSRFAHVTVLTGSRWDILELGGNLKAAEMIRGSLMGIPFVLSRRAREISTPDPKSRSGRSRRTKWLLHVEPNPRWVQYQLAAMERAATPGLTPERELPLLVASTVVDVDDDIDELEPADAVGADRDVSPPGQSITISAPATAQDEERRTSEPPPTAGMWKQWDKLAAWAKELRLDVDAVSKAISGQALAARGHELRARINLAVEEAHGVRSVPQLEAPAESSAPHVDQAVAEHPIDDAPEERRHAGTIQVPPPNRTSEEEAKSAMAAQAMQDLFDSPPAAPAGLCSNCGSAIAPGRMLRDGGQATAERVAEITMGAWGVRLCANCHRQRINEGQKPGAVAAGR